MGGRGRVFAFMHSERYSSLHLLYQTCWWALVSLGFVCGHRYQGIRWREGSAHEELRRAMAIIH